ncbi:cyclase family protein [Actinocrispum wychmicini]|uniref:Cyclase n=1 Tax=Actinocrispum wychmicini TaxID=1213861 RepID=A0A4R2JXC5_9PSEU|nr:cyclase family protein [Actinocrispum wychmicini]TCO62048.1 cyclase [Actinocrispum wychmicini]
MRLIDLSSPVDATFWEPDPVRHEPMSPAEGARHMASELREHLGIDFDPEMLPGGEFLNNDTFTLTVHTGTHVDAPAHYGSTASYSPDPPRTIDQMPLDWFLAPGVLLDLYRDGPGLIDRDDIAAELDRIGHDISPGDIVLLRTGADRHVGTPKYFTDFAGLTGPAVHLLLDKGVKVIGTDAFSLDAPFPFIVEQWQATGDRAGLWPAHFAGRDREYCQIERLSNLDQLPAPTGFTVACFPVKLARAGAGWARAVALLDL